MTSTSAVQHRLRQIQRQILELRAEEAVLQDAAPAAWLIDSLLPNEKLSKRNVRKIIILARIKDYLLQKGDAGASTQEISTYLERDAAIELKPATLRSHLSRFANEGRITQCKEARKWFCKK